jgi:sulfate transport system ATP-binding protein
VRLDLERADTRDMVLAELTRETFDDLAFKPGEQVHILPRKLQVFLDDYSI